MVITGTYLIYPAVYLDTYCITFDISDDDAEYVNWKYVYIDCDAGIQEIRQVPSRKRTWS